MATPFNAIDALAQKLAKKVVADLLDKGLKGSTWREGNEQPYRDLLHYRQDMVNSVYLVLREGLR